MSRLAPDIPELHDVPEAARSLVYMGAFNRAARSPLTWLTGALVFVAALVVGATQGRAFLGGTGALPGAALGASASIWCFFKLILPWQARRFVASVAVQSGGRTFDQVQQVNDRVRRMVEAAGRADTTADRRPPEPRP